MRAHRTATVPLALRRLPRWVRHTQAKVPLAVNGGAASSTDASTWGTFTDAAASRVGVGLGFVLAADGIACVDLDHCLTDGVLESWAREIVDEFPPTFVEVSPSGTGLHIWCRGVVGRGRRTSGVEVYDRGRYMTVTGVAFEDAPLRLAPVSSVLAAL